MHPVGSYCRNFFTKINCAGSQEITVISLQVSYYIQAKGLVSKRYLCFLFQNTLYICFYVQQTAASFQHDSLKADRILTCLTACILLPGVAVRANTRNLSLNGNNAFITWNVSIPALNTHTYSYHRIRHTNFTVFGSYNYAPNISWLLVIILLPNTGHTWYQQSTRTLFHTLHADTNTESPEYNDSSSGVGILPKWCK